MLHLLFRSAAGDGEILHPVYRRHVLMEEEYGIQRNNAQPEVLP